MWGLSRRSGGARDLGVGVQAEELGWLVQGQVEDVLDVALARRLRRDEVLGLRSTK